MLTDQNVGDINNILSLASSTPLSTFEVERINKNSSHNTPDTREKLYGTTMYLLSLRGNIVDTTQSADLVVLLAKDEGITLHLGSEHDLVPEVDTPAVGFSVWG